MTSPFFARLDVIALPTGAARPVPGAAGRATRRHPLAALVPARLRKAWAERQAERRFQAEMARIEDLAEHLLDDVGMARTDDGQLRLK